ncbi:MAG TPA: TetR/AcrR family transcriptional regulator [Myxococcales bacterium]|nr:TetR/AcrR family transcriptional regulator [Myxococcales bacterium]
MEPGTSPDRIETAPKPGEPGAEALSIRARQSLATRNRIFEVAMAEIADAGLAGIRIEHIARKAGVTRPTIYAHFPTREDFLRELQQRTEASALDAVRVRMQGSQRGHFLHRFADATIDLLADANPVLRRETFALMLREPRREEWMGNALFGFLEDRVAQAQSQGEIRREMPARALTRILMVALFGFFVIESDELEAKKTQAHQMLDLLIGDETP